MKTELIETDWLKHWGQCTPNSVALSDGHNSKSITYKEFYDQACALAWILKNKFQVQSGDRVALLAQNELLSIVLFFALQRLGAVLVPVNIRLTPKELDYIFSDCRPCLIIHGENFSSHIKSLSAENQKIPKCLLNSEVSTKTESLQELLNRSSAAELETTFACRFDDPVMILYTSGTTGFPKGALLSHGNLFWNSISTSMSLSIQQNDSAVIFLPLFHTGGWNVLTTPFIHRGAQIILLKKFEADLVLQITSQKKCTLLFGVPTTMDMMTQSEHFKKVDLSHLRYAIVGGEPLAVDLIQTWHKKGVPIRQGYGLTEFGPNVFSLNADDSIRKIGSIGFANFYIQTQIVNESGQLCQTNEVGELCLSGPAMMKGYWNSPKATAETIRNGWLYTGDLVRKDSEGYFYVVGRKKEMFISGAENVYPAEIEQVLRLYPGVHETAVIGVSDPQWGEVGKAYISIEKPIRDQRPPQDFIEGLKEHCQKNLAKFKIPKHFEIIDELPKSESGKILKRGLK